MTQKQFENKVGILFKKKRQELLDQLKRLDKREKEGWGYRRVWRKAHKVPAYKVGGHYAMLPIKQR